MRFPYPVTAYLVIILNCSYARANIWSMTDVLCLTLHTVNVKFDPFLHLRAVKTA